MNRRTKLAVVVSLLVLGFGVRDADAEMLLVPEGHPTIQSALNVAVSGDLVSVAPGVYNENVRFWAHDVTLRSRVLHAATIDGGGTGHVVTFNPYSGTVEGFVITGSGDGFYSGVFTSQASQVIRNNIITGNNGDGISVSSGSVAWIEKNLITNNGSFDAGIKCKTGASATIVNNYIAQHRYGIYCNSTGSFVITNNTVVDHVNYNLFVAKGTAVITNNILSNAKIGMYFAGSFDADITSKVAEHLTISYNDVWGNSMHDYWAGLGGVSENISGPFSPSPGIGEIGADPLLNGAVGNRLQSGSPCIDAGDSTFIAQEAATDLGGSPRFLCNRIDIGAYEFTGDYDCDQARTLRDIAALQTCFTGEGGGYSDPACESFDTDSDQDIDLQDYAHLQELLAAESQ